MCGCQQDCSECPIGLAKETDMKVPYQLHITVEYKLEKGEMLEPWNRFKAACEELGIKPLWIKNVTLDRQYLHEFITSFNMTGDDSAYNEIVDTLNNQADTLAALGFNVQRRKIETVPWHQAVKGSMNKDQYFETHILLNEDAPQSAWDKLTSIQADQNLHYSESIKGKSFVTFREYGTRFERYRANLNWALYKIRECGFTLSDKIITEFALFDTDFHFDDKWMQREVPSIV